MNHRNVRLGLATGLVVGVAGVAWGQAPAGDPPKPAPAPTGTPSAPGRASETEKTVNVIMSTSMGDITIELNRDKAPVSVDNFLKYVDEKFYDGTVFHRVIDGFMIQGGGFSSDKGGTLAKKQTHAPIKNEWKNGLKNVRGSIAMARIGGQADSGSSQFFINVKDNAALDQPNDGSAYAVFGRVTAGMDVVDKIKAVKTGRNTGMENVPTEPVEITSVRRAEGAKKEPAKAEPKPEGKTGGAPKPPEAPKKGG